MFFMVQNKIFLIGITACPNRNKASILVIKPMPEMKITGVQTLFFNKQKCAIIIFLTTLVL